MKNLFGVLMALVVGAAAIAQVTPHEKAVVHNDLARERDKRNDVARDIVHGNPEKARADHRAAVNYHQQAHRDLRQMHRKHVVKRKYHHPRVRRHNVHHRPARHHRTTVVVRH